MLPSSSSFHASKPVLGPDSTTIGRVAGAERDPDTRDTVSLLVQLDPERAPDAATQFCWLPVARVQGIRRDRIQLNERLSAILREAGRLGAHPSDGR